MSKENKIGFKFGAVPAILVVLVTLALGIASAKGIAHVLNMPKLFPLLVVGFLSGEFLIVSWFFEPQKGIFTKKQMSVVQSAKYALLGAGFIDGILLAISAGMDIPPLWIIVAQAAVSIGAIFWCAIASMILVDNDADRIIAIERADVRLRNRVAQLKMELQAAEDRLKTKEIRLNISAEIRRQVGRAAASELSSPEMRAQLDSAGREVARMVVDKFLVTSKKVIGGGGGVSKIAQDKGDTAKKPLPPVNGKRVFVN